MKDAVKRAVKRALGVMGLDLVRVKPDEKLKLLGLRDVRTILDVGANAGQFAALARKVFPDAAIHCFEPQPDAFRALEAWCARDGGGRAKAYNVALGEREGTVEMWAGLDWDLSSSLLKSTEAS